MFFVVEGNGCCDVFFRKRTLKYIFFFSFIFNVRVLLGNKRKNEI